MIGGRPYTDRTTLIKGGYVLTLDPELGDLPLTDVLIDGEKIAAIGRNLTVSPNANVIDATNRIVMPGFIDTHRHTWQTPICVRHVRRPQRMPHRRERARGVQYSLVPR